MKTTYQPGYYQPLAGRKKRPFLFSLQVRLVAWWMNKHEFWWNYEDEKRWKMFSTRKP